MAVSFDWCGASSASGSSTGKVPATGRVSEERLVQKRMHPSFRPAVRELDANNRSIGGRNPGALERGQQRHRRNAGSRLGALCGPSWLGPLPLISPFPCWPLLQPFLAAHYAEITTYYPFAVIPLSAKIAFTTDLRYGQQCAVNTPCSVVAPQPSARALHSCLGVIGSRD